MSALSVTATTTGGFDNSTSVTARSVRPDLFATVSAMNLPDGDSLTPDKSGSATKAATGIRSAARSGCEAIAATLAQARANRQQADSNFICSSCR